MSDFSSRPFVAGSLIGLRSFSVDDDGVLVGPAYPDPFLPGENQAQCYSSIGWRVQMRAFERSLARIAGSQIPEPLTLVPSEKKGHQPGGLRCSCGFYAFFDGSNTYELSTRVTAIIEGYGVCSVGDRGFRAEKARLVALVGDVGRARPGRPFHRALDATSDWLTDRKIGGGAAAISGPVGLYTLVFGVYASIDLSPLLAPIVALIVAACAFLGYADFHSIPRKYPSVSPEVKRCVIPPKSGRLGAAPFKTVAARYPDVPVYRTVEEAIAAHPLTVPTEGSGDVAV